MLTILTTFLSPLLGFAGSFLKGWQDEKKADREHERELQQLAAEKEIINLENQGKANVANIERETQADIEGSKNLRAAIKADKASYISGIKISEFIPLESTGKFIIWALAMVDVARGCVRPFCTAWGMGLLSIMVWKAIDGSALPTGISGDTIIIAAINYIGVMLGFWFGDKMQRKNKK